MPSSRKFSNYRLRKAKN